MDTEQNQRPATTDEVGFRSAGPQAGRQPTREDVDRYRDSYSRGGFQPSVAVRRPKLAKRHLVASRQIEIGLRLNTANRV